MCPVLALDENMSCFSSDEHINLQKSSTRNSNGMLSSDNVTKLINIAPVRIEHLIFDINYLICILFIYCTQFE